MRIFGRRGAGGAEVRDEQEMGATEKEQAGAGERSGEVGEAWDKGKLESGRAEDVSEVR